MGTRNLLLNKKESRASQETEAFALLTYCTFSFLFWACTHNTHLPGYEGGPGFPWLLSVQNMLKHSLKLLTGIIDWKRRVWSSMLIHSEANQYMCKRIICTAACWDKMPHCWDMPPGLLFSHVAFYCLVPRRGTHVPKRVPVCLMVDNITRTNQGIWAGKWMREDINSWELHPNTMNGELSHWGFTGNFA